MSMQRKYLILLYFLLGCVIIPSFTLAASSNTNPVNSLVNAISKMGLQQASAQIITAGNGNVMLTDPVGYGFVRFVIAIVLFSLFYVSLGKMFGDRKNVIVALALCLSVLSVLGLPNTWIYKIFVTFGWLGPLLIFFGLVMAGYFLQEQFKEHNLICGFIMIMIAAIMFIVIEIMENLLTALSGNEGLAWITGILWIAAFIYAIMGIGKVLGGFSSGGVKAAGDAGQKVGETWNGLKETPKKIKEAFTGEKKKLETLAEQRIHEIETINNITIDADEHIRENLNSVKRYINATGFDEAFDKSGKKDQICQAISNQVKRLINDESGIEKYGKQVRERIKALKAINKASISLTANEDQLVKQERALLSKPYKVKQQAYAAQKKREAFQTEKTTAINALEPLCNNLLGHEANTQNMLIACLHAIEGKTIAAIRTSIDNALNAKTNEIDYKKNHVTPALNNYADIEHKEYDFTVLGNGMP